LVGLALTATGSWTVPADLVETHLCAEAELERQAANLGMRIAWDGAKPGLVDRASGKSVQPWREDYPYHRRMKRRPYRLTIGLLQIELLKLQRSVKADGRRLLVVFEGRDAAGKGGTIRRFTENLNPRGVRVVALERPGEYDQGAHYLRRYLAHLPASGEIVLLDRSWYNRAGVERVMGFCAAEEYRQFLADAPGFEQMITDDGVELVKLWFSVTRTEQLKRLIQRSADPVKRWRLSAVDLASLDRWDDYTWAEAEMFRRTHLPAAPWMVVESNDKRRARVESMRHVLSLSDYVDKLTEAVGTPDPLIVHRPITPTGPA
jgi:polyphosphate kinase 2